MTTVKEIETAIGALPREQFFELVTWLKHQFEDQWDRQIEEDVKAGRLDRLAHEALAEYRTGQTRPLPSDEESCDQ